MKALNFFIVFGLLLFSCSPPEEIRSVRHYDDYKISVSVRDNDEAITSAQSVCLRYANFVDLRRSGKDDDLVKLEFIVNKIGDAGLKQIREDLGIVPHVISISINKLN